MRPVTDVKGQAEPETGLAGWVTAQGHGRHGRTVPGPVPECRTSPEVKAKIMMKMLFTSAESRQAKILLAFKRLVKRSKRRKIISAAQPDQLHRQSLIAP